MQKNTTDNSHIEAQGNVQIGDNITNIGTSQTPSVPRLLTNVVPIESNGIIGRKKEMRDTYDLLHAGKTAVLFNGVGGIGKTTVAREYMVQFQSDYAHLAWLTANQGIASAFVDDVVLLKNLGLTDDINALMSKGGGDAGQLAAFQCVLNVLSNQPKVLVVVDNANDLADFAQYRNLLKSRQPTRFAATFGH